MARKKHPGGRPTRHKGERLSKTRTFRVRGSLDKQLENSASAAGRSVSEEIEYRLDRSYWDDAFMALVTGAHENTQIVKMIARAVALCEGWRGNPEKTRDLQDAALIIFAQFSFPEIPPPADFIERFTASGIALADVALRDGGFHGVLLPKKDGKQ